jgi:hypothetical protein
MKHNGQGKHPVSTTAEAIFFTGKQCQQSYLKEMQNQLVPKSKSNKSSPGLNFFSQIQWKKGKKFNLIIYLSWSITHFFHLVFVLDQFHIEFGHFLFDGFPSTVDLKTKSDLILLEIVETDKNQGLRIVKNISKSDDSHW